MKKGIKIGIWFVVAFAMVICLAFCAYHGYGKWKNYSYKQQIKKPYIQDAETSLAGSTALETYKKFREALKNGNKEKALQYIFLSEREEYRKDFQDSEIVKNYLDMQEAEELKKESEFECSGEALACKRKAEFYYEYEVEEEQKEKDLENGYKFRTLKQGVHKHSIIFIKNLAGKWQISSL